MSDSLDGYKFTQKDSHKLVDCTHKDNAPYMNKDEFKAWYKNAICFKKNRKIEMRSSWW